MKMQILFLCLLIAVLVAGAVVQARAEGTKGPFGKVLATTHMNPLHPQRKIGNFYDLYFGPDGKLYMPDYGNYRVVVLDDDLNYVTEISGMPTPHSVTMDAKRDLYVASHRTGRIIKYDSKYQELADWDKQLRDEGRTKSPVTVEPGENGHLYVGDWLFNQVIKVDGNGKYVLTFEDVAIKQKGEFLPHGIAVHGKGSVYVADRGVGTIHVFTQEGKYLKSWNKSIDTFDPVMVRFLTPELLIVPNYKNGFVHIFDTDGNELAVLEQYGDPAEKFNNLTSITIGKNSIVYFIEFENDRVRKVDFSDLIKAFAKGKRE